MNPTTRALLVMVLDGRTQDWLFQNDPKALEQALRALASDPQVVADPIMRAQVALICSRLRESKLALVLNLFQPEPG